MKTLTSMILGAATAFFLAQPVGAQPMPAPAAHGGGMGHMGHMGHAGGMMHGDGAGFMMLLRSADLTPAQKGQLRDIMKSHHAQIMAVHQEFQSVHEQLAAKLLTPGPVTAADLAPLEQKAFRDQKRIDQSMIDTALAIRNILTPEQLSKLSQVHQKLESLHAQIQSLMGGDEGGEDQQN